MKTLRSALLLALALLTGPALARAGTLVDLKGELGPAPDSSTKSFPFEVTEPNVRVSLDTTATLTRGKVTIQVFDPGGRCVTWYATGGRMTVQEGALDLGGKTGQFRVAVVAEGAVGEWSVRISELPPLSMLWILLASGGGMIVVALASVGLWKTWSKAQWRWFWVGAAVWTVGVALKFAAAIPLNGPILGALKGGLPHAAYLAAGSVYIGLLTGVFEIGVTLAAALIWRRMALDAGRAVAVGVGAGAFEALLVGLVTAGSAVAVVLNMRGSGNILAALGSSAAITPLVWLAGPAERIIAILCHTSSRALVLMSVATRRWTLFAWAFLLMTGLDAIAGYVHLSGGLGRMSAWWIELVLAPFAVVSVPIVLWCVRRWPGAAAAKP
jgi:hypothetical protein